MEKAEVKKKVMKKEAKKKLCPVKGYVSLGTKKRVDKILGELELTHSQVIGLFYGQIALHRGMPFEIRVPTKRGLKIKEDLRELDRKEKRMDEKRSGREKVV